MTEVSIASLLASAEYRFGPDAQVAQAGPLSVVRDGPVGLEGGAQDAMFSFTTERDALSRPIRRRLRYGMQTLHQEELVYDGARVAERRESWLEEGLTHTETAVYKSRAIDRGQVTEVTRTIGLAAATTESYAYDANGNRTHAELPGRDPEDATYSPYDVLQTHGASAYTFDSDGFLTQRGADTFVYSARGELLEARVDGTTITYGYDAFGRRISRTDAAGTEVYLYANLERPHRITHAYRSDTARLTSYFYDDLDRLRVFEVTPGPSGSGFARYYVATDSVGSPVLVADEQGAVVKVIRYETFGAIARESLSTVRLPFGFAGGLHDRVTKLVRFGARDYDTLSGRYTARLPHLRPHCIDGYQYLRNDPATARDPSGLACDTNGAGVLLSAVLSSSGTQDAGCTTSSCGGIDGQPSRVIVAAVREICFDEIDNDGDGLVDEQPCIIFAGCTTSSCGGIDLTEPRLPITAAPAEICGDGIDNDGDGLIDEGACVLPGLRAWLSDLRRR
jgi:RHS repeat-associated protein